jgi:hypothetical protein
LIGNTSIRCCSTLNIYSQGWRFEHQSYTSCTIQIACQAHICKMNTRFSRVRSVTPLAATWILIWERSRGEYKQRLSIPL